MRIALFTDTFLPQINGVVTAIRISAEELVRRGHAVAVFTVEGDRDYETDELPPTVQVFRFRALKLPTYPGMRVRLPTFAPTLKQVRSFAPELIHSHTLFGVGWEAVLAARRLHLPLVGTHHAFLDEYIRHVKLRGKVARRVSYRYTTLYYNRCDLVLSPSHALAEDLRAHGVEREIRVLPNPVSLRDFHSSRDRESLRRHFGMKGFAIVYLGRLSYEKSISLVIRAFATIVQGGDSVAELYLVGDGPERGRLERLVASLGLRDRVHFLGFHRGQDVVDILTTADFFVSASKTENLPMTFLEAMAAGLPIVAVRARGVPEIVEHQGNGLLVEPDDALAFARAMRRLAEHLKEREAMGRRSCELVKRYDSRRVVAELEDIYSQVLATRKIQMSKS